jgi:hypothetical protein
MMPVNNTINPDQRIHTVLTGKVLIKNGLQLELSLLPSKLPCDKWFPGLGKVLLHTEGESWRFVGRLLGQHTSSKRAQTSEMSLSVEGFRNSPREK